jgi:TolB-like protein
MSLFAELKRRNVVKAALLYVIAAWLIMQVGEIMVPVLVLPDWVLRLVFLLLALGFPLAIIFSWVYELTPEGLKRDKDIDPSASIGHETSHKLNYLIVGLLVAAIGLLLANRFWPAADTADSTEVAQPATAPETVADGLISVAVLPFVNMSDDRQNEYFSDGISEELLNVLVRIKSLRVPSRTSSFTFKGSDKNLSEIGRELQVDHILEGSVRKAGDQIRVTAQLVEVESDTHLWSATYTRELDDVFAVQDEIAQAIVEALQLTLSGADQEILGTHSTSNVEAYNKYLLGRHFWNQRTPQSLLSAVKALREAVEMDPEYDQAWAALADTYVLIPEYRAGTIEEFIPLAREATNKALAINPNSARALTTSGYYKAVYDYDWEGANADFERAVVLEPGYANAHQWYGEILAQQGRLEEGLLQLQLARNADPLSAIVRHVPGYMLLWSLRLDEAEVHLMDTLELGGQPLRWTIHNLDMLNTLRGNYDEARRRARQLARMEGYDPAADLARIDAIENPALKDRALILLQQRQDRGEGVFGKALQYALLEEYELALESLEKAFAAGDPYATQMNYIKIYDPLRDNPRFQAMLKKMNLLP